MRVEGTESQNLKPETQNLIAFDHVQITIPIGQEQIAHAFYCGVLGLTEIEKPESLVSVYAFRPLEVAVETATINLMDWLIADYGFTPIDAYCLVSTCPDFRINVYQMCRLGKLNYVAGAEIPKRCLPPVVTEPTAAT